LKFPVSETKVLKEALSYEAPDLPLDADVPRALAAPRTTRRRLARFH
jgi:hypothetical protein